MTLAEKLEKADFGSRYLDATITAELRIRPENAPWLERWGNSFGAEPDPKHHGVVFALQDDGQKGPNWSAKPYTSSLNAALTLIPENFDWILEHTNGGLTIRAQIGPGDKGKAFGATHALAICAAAIKVRAAL